MGKRENYFLSYEKGYVMPYILSEKKNCSFQNLALLLRSGRKFGDNYGSKFIDYTILY